MWADPAVAPSSPPREAQETSEILSVHLCQQKQFCRFPTTARAAAKRKQLCLKGKEKLPHGCRTLTPLSRGDPEQCVTQGLTHPIHPTAPSVEREEEEGLSFCSRGSDTPATAPTHPAQTSPKGLGSLAAPSLCSQLLPKLVCALPSTSSAASSLLGPGRG